MESINSPAKWSGLDSGKGGTGERASRREVCRMLCLAARIIKMCRQAFGKALKGKPKAGSRATSPGLWLAFKALIVYCTATKGAPGP